MTDYDKPFAAKLAGEIIREMREREQITCSQRAECYWSHADTCRLCNNGQNKTTVLAVNKGGIKK